MRHKVKFYLIVAGLFLFAVAMLLIYGIATHKEAGFITACWPKKEGYLLYSKNCVHEVKWEKKQVPLTVRLALENSVIDYKKSIQAAMATWNRELGLVFIEVISGDADVVIRWGPTQNGASGGYTQHIGININGSRKILRSTVTLTEPSDLHAVYRYAMHELGHVLGLDHDVTTRSIMYPIQPGMTENLVPALPSDSDIRLLKQAYKD